MLTLHIDAFVLAPHPSCNELDELAIIAVHRNKIWLRHLA
jgi:hypothetical protein